MTKTAKVILERRPTLTFRPNQRAETRTSTQASLVLLAPPLPCPPSLKDFLSTLLKNLPNTHPLVCSLVGKKLICTSDHGIK